MSNVAKLKKKAAELEERRQYDKALAVYEQVLTQMNSADEELDVSLFNRVGDLTLRQGNVTQAVSYYERAVDLYTDGGFLNNAIALCNKILRNAPGRTSIYYKLGKISARKGFTSDAKQNFLEFADRMQKAGQWEEAFSALEEFANLCPDQDDVRLMLAEQLTRRNRNPEALEQLQILYGKYSGEGRATEANATLERMRFIEPDIVPQVAQQSAPEKSGDLIFLDLSVDGPSKSGGAESGKRPSGAQPALKISPAEPPAAPPREGRDPRASGELMVIRGIEQANMPLSPHADGDIIRAGEYFGSSGSTGIQEQDAPALDEMLVQKQEFERPVPLHDLALAGILPVLDTPGLEPIDVPLDDFDTGDSDVELAVLDVDYGGLLTSMAERGESSDASMPDPNVSAADLLEIERTSQDGMTLESRITVTNLDIVHGALPTSIESEEFPANAEAATEALQIEPSVELTSALSTESLKSIASSDAEIAALIKLEPNDFSLHRRLGEVLIENGKRQEGLASLDASMTGFEDLGAISDALSVAEEILRLEPNSIRHHQKRVEYSYRNNDQALLIDSYLELADALFRTSQITKASVVYERVLELAPENSRANFALSAMVASSATAVTSETAAKSPEAKPAVSPTVEDTSSFVNLGDLLRADEGPRSTRMVVEDDAPSGDEEADFAEMLERFKRGLAENVDEEDYESHYDLGVAFREMGLLDESISEFQKALRGTTRRVRTLEALGQCFVERSQWQVAANVLDRALREDEATDVNLVGVLYLLGYANEAMQKYAEALGYYQRVFMVDIQFRDVTTRIAALEKMVK